METSWEKSEIQPLKKRKERKKSLNLIGSWLANRLVDIRSDVHPQSNQLCSGEAPEGMTMAV
jgi:hypothetical protein